MVVYKLICGDAGRAFPRLVGAVPTPTCLPGQERRAIVSCGSAHTAASDSDLYVWLRATRGCREKCVALPEGGDDTCCSASSPLPRRASPATAGCEALGTTDPHPRGWRSEREPRSRLPAPWRSGTRGAWYGQPR